ncbi:hypothetical protein [Paenibacillus antibioticophila]|uniref:hypothetical protein n=1 Tax=Paenibacillus antibioticophila TaxID=1274374 RepID=UPI0013051626|nr:hypothetical protein [Paenibacillus antibioticophila]
MMAVSDIVRGEVSDMSDYALTGLKDSLEQQVVQSLDPEPRLELRLAEKSAWPEQKARSVALWIRCYAERRLIGVL